MPYINPYKWSLDHTNPKERSFDDHTHTQVASFHPDVFSIAYVLRPPQQLFTAKFFDASMSQFDFEEVIQYWMENLLSTSPKMDNYYPVSWFREPFSMLVAMFCHLYGLPNCSAFKFEWDLISHHLLITGDSFN